MTKKTTAQNYLALRQRIAEQTGIESEQTITLICQLFTPQNLQAWANFKGIEATLLNEQSNTVEIFSKQIPSIGSLTELEWITYIATGAFPEGVTDKTE